MELQHFSHSHSLIFNEDSDHKSNCSGCGELMSGPNFSCMACGFYLDKDCAKAPSELAHPFHHDHNLNLLNSLNLRKHYQYRSGCFCDFCYKNCENFVYHCSCNLDLHIKCALFLYNIVEKKVGELQIAHIDPLISTEVPSEELKKAECFACWKPLLDSAHLSLDSGFCLHKKCVELPLEINYLCHPQHSLYLQFNSQHLPCQICLKPKRRGFVYCCSPCQFVLHIECAELPTKINHLCHRQHSLLLQFNRQSLSCQICQKPQSRGFVYCCSPCQFVLHIECVSPTSSHIIEDRRSHEHPFSRFFRQVSFICDACGTSGDHVSYICSTCSLTVHKECVSLPRIIKSLWHHHPIFHQYFVVENEALDCGICHEEVNKVYGSYYCSECKFIAHVNCIVKYSEEYYEIDKSSKDAYENEYQILTVNDPPFNVIRETNLGENIISMEIKHFSHKHNLVSSSDEVKNERSYCNGCSLLITTPFYQCLQCSFFLHKSCAELPKKKIIWFHIHFQQPLVLVPNIIFKCDGYCEKQYCSGFAYRCKICRFHYCVRCTKVSLSCTSQGHKHLLLIYPGYNGECNACGCSIFQGALRCKGCNFNVHIGCSLLPQTVVHKSDQHLLKLTYQENNDYSEHHYCDICEERRSHKIWFYHCTICNTSTHLECALGDYRFMKRGIRTFIENDHPHDLIVVEKVYDYPEACCKCGKPCLYLALQCSETGCNYIVHWRCSAKLSRLRWYEAVEYK